MKIIVLFILLFSVISCSQPKTPQKWIELGLPTDNRVKVTGNTDEHGYYADYEGVTEKELKSRVENAFKVAGFQYAGDAFEGAAWGYQKNEEKYAIKIEQSGSIIHLSVFNEKGIDPLIHGVIFSKYTEGEKISGDAAKEMLLKELEGNK